MRSRLVRLVLVTMLVLAVLLCALPMSVAAGKPFRFLAPTTGFEFDSSCGFPVRYDVLQDNGYWTIFFDAQGNEVRWILAGVVKGRLTNLDNGESVEFVVGPAQYTLDGGNIWTFRGTGSGFNDWGPDPPAGLPKLMLFSGQLTLKLDFNTGAAEFVSLRGKAVDVCALLGD